MEIDEVLEQLDLVNVESRLQEFSYKQLLTISSVLLKRMRIGELSRLLSDPEYFTSRNLIRTLEKIEDRELLYQFFHEPRNQRELEISIENWLTGQGFDVTYEVPDPLGKGRFIDILGWRDLGYGERKFTRLWENKELMVIQSLLKASQGAIEKTFTQTVDYVKCAHFCYVALSPYSFFKYPTLIMSKARNFKGIGVLLADRSKVVNVLSEATKNSVDRARFNDLKKLSVRNLKT